MLLLSFPPSWEKTDFWQASAHPRSLLPCSKHCVPTVPTWPCVFLRVRQYLREINPRGRREREHCCSACLCRLLFWPLWPPQTPGRVHLSWDAVPARWQWCPGEEARSDPPQPRSTLTSWTKTKSQQTRPPHECRRADSPSEPRMRRRPGRPEPRAQV